MKLRLLSAVYRLVSSSLSISKEPEKHRHFLAALATVCLTFAGNAQAILIVDTGAGSTTSGGLLVSSSPPQWLAGQFAITNSYTVTSVEGWFGDPMGGVLITLTAAIYTDNGSGVPISELFSAQFALDNPIYSVNNAWDGAFGLSWALAPGTYWLAFEQRSEDSGEGGFMPHGIDGAPNPLADYALWEPSQWTSIGSDAALGMRISAIPIPATVWLFASGVLGLIGIARRRKAT
jgi:hypothetical protein